jgi:DNA polymerase-3 subunit beta
MHFISNKQELNHLIYIVQRAVTPKTPMPILTGIKFETAAESLTVTATDLEMGIKCTIPVSVIEEGATVLPSRYISELIRRLPEVPIMFKEDSENGSVTVKYGESEININSFPEEEYPDISLPEQDHCFYIVENVLRDILRQIVFAIASEDSRAALTGAQLTIGKNNLEMVATDLHRLSWCSVPVENSDYDQISVIIPGKTLTELSKVIGKGEDMVKITITENQVLFSTENISFISRLINGKFPKYKQVIPEKSLTTIRVNTQNMLEAAERAAVINTEDKSSITLDIKDNVMIIADTTIAGQVYEEVPISLYGEPTKIGFNANYLMELLKVFKSEEIDLELSGPFSPGIFRPVGDMNYFSLILPVRIHEDQ